VSARQPGNNFIVAASGRQEYIDAVTFAANGTTLLRETGGVELPENVRTPKLTVWRTLNVEQDSLGWPDLGQVFDGAGEGNDDEAPGDIGGNPASGHFTNPSLSLLTAELAHANVAVKVLGLADGDIDEDVPFVRNIENPLYGFGASGVRNITSAADFWAVQILLAYEGLLSLDFDPPLGEIEEGRGGQTVQDAPGPIHIYLETIRDVAANAVLEDGAGGFIEARDADTIARRTIVHEAMHRFGHADHDVSLMNYDNLHFRSDAINRLTGAMLREIATRHVP